MSDSGSRPRRAQTRSGTGQNSEFPLLSQPETGENGGTKAYASPAEIAARHIRDALQIICRSLDGLAAIEARLFVALEQLEAPPLHAGGFTAGYQTRDEALEPDADNRERRPEGTYLVVVQEAGGERHYIGGHAIHAGDGIRAFVRNEWRHGRYEAIWMRGRITSAWFYSGDDEEHTDRLTATTPVKL